MSADTQSADPQAVRANKLELVERLADDLAHEIKNPLHAMVINLEVLKRRIARPGGSEPDELMRYIGVLGSELERVNRRVELLLRMVRPERGDEPTSLTETVEELLEVLELERERHAVSIRFEPAPLPVRHQLPRETTRQMVLNLLLYALDHLAAGGQLVVSTEVEPGWIRLRVDGRQPPGVSGGGSELPALDEREARLTVARSLAVGFGGSLEVLGQPVAAPREHALSLSLPLDAG